MAELKIELSAPVSGHLPVLDELKGLAIGLIVLYHAGGVLVWKQLPPRRLGGGSVHPPQRRGAGLRRAVRGRLALPDPALAAHHAGLLGGADALRRRQRAFPPVHYSILNLLAHYLGIHVLFGDAWGLAINDSFWFVSAILGFYLCYCPLRRLLDRPDRFLLWAAVLSTGVALLLFFTGQSGLMGLLGSVWAAFSSACFWATS